MTKPNTNLPLMKGVGGDQGSVQSESDLSISGIKLPPRNRKKRSKLDSCGATPTPGRSLEPTTAPVGPAQFEKIEVADVVVGVNEAQERRKSIKGARKVASPTMPRSNLLKNMPKLFDQDEPTPDKIRGNWGENGAYEPSCHSRNTQSIIFRDDDSVPSVSNQSQFYDPNQRMQVEMSESASIQAPHHPKNHPERPKNSKNPFDRVRNLERLNSNRLPSEDFTMLISHNQGEDEPQDDYPGNRDNLSISGSYYQISEIELDPCFVRYEATQVEENNELIESLPDEIKQFGSKFVNEEYLWRIGLEKSRKMNQMPVNKIKELKGSAPKLENEREGFKRSRPNFGVGGDTGEVKETEMSFLPSLEAQACSFDAGVLKTAEQIEEKKKKGILHKRSVSRAQIYTNKQGKGTKGHKKHPYPGYSVQKNPYKIGMLKKLKSSKKSKNHENQITVYHKPSQGAQKDTLGPKVKKKTSFFCEICQCEITTKFVILTRFCGHRCCKPCFCGYLKHVISNKVGDRIECPFDGCGVQLQPMFIHDFLLKNEPVGGKVLNFFCDKIHWEMRLRRNMGIGAKVARKAALENKVGGVEIEVRMS